MKFSLSWLQDYLATKKSLDEILSIMLQAGLEYEEVHDPASELAAFTVAKVRETQPHPDADRLKICQVDTIDGPKTIVCGAPNARTGMTAIYAPLGSYIPGIDLHLDKKPRKIRGVESHGMLCSTKELNAGEDHDGIADLPSDIPLGASAAEALDMADPVIDFEVTPNRPDWLGVMGIARDLAAAGAGRFMAPKTKPIPGKYDCPVEIEIHEESACPVFHGVHIRGVKNGPSPEWMQRRLLAVGIQPKSLLVDVTNYISLDQARPLHAYDADKLAGAVVARLGKSGESLVALDGKTYDLGPDMCVIADDSGAIGLGGVMGGESTAVADGTTNVFLEAAWFDPLRTARTGRTTGINSDAKYRFERGVDPESCAEGLAAAAHLILEYGGGEASNPVIAGAPPEKQKTVVFKKSDVERLTGLSVKPQKMKTLLKDLGCTIEDSGDAWYVEPPTWRFDIEQSADFVEEIARLVGFDALPTTSLPTPEGGIRAMLSPTQSQIRIGRRALASRGYQEAVSWSFMARDHAAMFAGGDNALAPGLAIANPVTSELDQMRPSIVGNLALAAQKAADRGERLIKLFEAGPIYRHDTPSGQTSVLTALIRPAIVRHWERDPTPSLFDLKADLFALLAAIGQPPERFQIVNDAGGAWHPGQSALLKLGPKVTVAHFGAVHPRVLKALDVAAPMFAFELDLSALPKPKGKAGKTRPVYDAPDQSPVRRDLAFLVSSDTPAGDIIRLAKSAEKTLITDVSVFDVYRGEGVEDGKASIAIEITLGPRGAPMKDHEIDHVVNKVVASVAKGTGAVLRG
ncbi:MAG: phenylalanine--tRNA ligase subunit beta [Pseudomonadota bacterium]